MKRVLIVLVMGTLLVVSSSVFGQVKDEFWDQFPDKEKAQLITTSYDGSRELSIMCFALTDRLLQIMGLPEELKEDTENILGGPCLLCFVAPSGSEYFWPTSFVFTQGYSQYQIRYGDFVPLEDAFSGGELKSGTIATGLIAIPDGIDPTRSFSIWYDDESASLGPIDFGGPLADSSSPQADLELAIDSLPETVVRGDVVIIQITTTPYANCALALYTRNGAVESSDLSPRTASRDGGVAWIWQTSSQTPPGLVMLQVMASLEDKSIAVLDSFVIIDQ